ncbi:pentapeptide repeat-containing protein [Tardiphaga sp. 619_E2_N8_5]|uniref:pentapeptide repeat-containing protein n=1 Tax=unclassified Tardiphaga TaxID=2631404 RepID=UPI003F26171F
MSDPSSVALLRDRQNFLAHHKAGTLPRLDLSNETISFDFSGLELSEVDFRGCTLRGSSFRGSRLQRCDFSGSDWADCEFESAYFNSGVFAKVRNAHKARHLHTVAADGFNTQFEFVIRPICLRLDWEALGALGRLPFFTASTTALVTIPIFIYMLALYNQHLLAIKLAVQAAGVSTPSIEAALAKLKPMGPPSLSLWALAAAFLLFIASGLYSFLCPSIVKQFSKDQWRYQFQQSRLTYWAQAWRFTLLRNVSALFYLIGGAIAVVVLSIKLYDAAMYIATAPR